MAPAATTGEFGAKGVRALGRKPTLEDLRSVGGHDRVAAVSVIVGVDVGGSGLRVQTRYAAGPGPVLTGPGVRVGPDGIDVGALARDARGCWTALVSRSPTWSFGG